MPPFVFKSVFELFSNVYLISFQVYYQYPFKIHPFQIEFWKPDNIYVHLPFPVKRPFVSFFLPECYEASSPQLTTRQSLKGRLNMKESLSL